jgi:predicted metalloprotease
VLGYLAVIPTAMTEFRLQIAQLQKVGEKMERMMEQMPTRLTILEGRMEMAEQDRAGLRVWLQNLRGDVDALQAKPK